MAVDDVEKSDEAGQEMRLPAALAGFFALVFACAWASLLFAVASRADTDPLGVSAVEPTFADWMTSAVAYVIVPFSGVSAILLFSFGVLRRGAIPLRLMMATAVTAVATLVTAQLLGFVTRLLR